VSGPALSATLLEPGERFEGATGARLVDVLDRLLDRGVVVRAEIWLTVADVDLVYVGADLVLASPETIRRGGSRKETAPCPG
jgi:hypothetical protein